MILRDKEGRIIRISPNDRTDTGHAACYYCGKDMPIVWEVVCLQCGRVLCYYDAKTDGEYWYCYDECPTEDTAPRKQHTRYEMLEI